MHTNFPIIYLYRCLQNYFQKAVISVPAYFGRLATSETEEAARRAGLQVEELIKEPTAAAYFYGFNKFECNEYNLLAFDLGGGTFDCTIVRVN